MKEVDYTVVVDGEATDDYTAGEPFQQADGTWAVFWSYAAGPLSEDEILEITIDYLVSHRLTDGLSTDPETGRLIVFGPGSIAYGECTITAE